MSLEQKQQKDLALYSPKKCFEYSHKIRTVKDAIALPSKTLGEFNRTYGRDWVIGYVSMWLIELNDNANVKQKMSDAQIEFTAERIYDSYPLKITDLTLFFRNVKEGRYGSYYENMSQEKVMQWLHEYWDERCEAGELMSQGRHDGFSMSKDAIHPEVAKKMFEGVGEEKVEFDHEKDGLGKRTDRILTEKAGNNMIEAYHKVKAMSLQELKDYLIEADVNSEDFNAYFYRLVEAELDVRNKKKR